MIIILYCSFAFIFSHHNFLYFILPTSSQTLTSKFDYRSNFRHFLKLFVTIFFYTRNCFYLNLVFISFSFFYCTKWYIKQIMDANKQSNHIICMWCDRNIGLKKVNDTWFLHVVENNIFFYITFMNLLHTVSNDIDFHCASCPFIIIFYRRKKLNSQILLCFSF